MHRKCLDSKLLTGFSIAGDDGRFVPAQAANEGDKVLVSSLLIERCQVCMERNGADEPCQSGGTPIGAIQNSMNYSFGRPPNQQIRLLSWAVKRFETDDSATELLEENLVTRRAPIRLMALLGVIGGAKVVSLAESSNASSAPIAEGRIVQIFN